MFLKKKKNSSSELERYEKQAKVFLKRNNSATYKLVGEQFYNPYLRKPYIDYHNAIKRCVKKNDRVLDLCCGNGLHSFTAAQKGAKVMAVDIAPKNIEIAKKRAEILNLSVEFICNNVDDLTLNRNQFDLITMAGSLSYLDQKTIFKKVAGWLKPSGVFIVVDSYNHNIIYRMNRYFHYLRSRRSSTVNKKIPDKKLVAKLSNHFSSVKINYYGIFVFLAPLFRLLRFKDDKIAFIINSLDNKFSFLKSYAFKIMLIAKK